MNNIDKIESNLSVPGIQGCHENTLCKNFETRPNFAIFQDNIGKSTNGSFQETRKTEKYVIAPNVQHKSG